MLDKTTKLQNELSSLQPELDRILYLLKIADPSGEAAKKRDSATAKKSDTKLEEAKPEKLKAPPSVNGKPRKEPIKDSGSEERLVDAKQEVKTTQESVETDQAVTEKIVDDTKDKKTTSYTVVKPQWLGAIEEMKSEDVQKDAAPLDIQNESDDFVDYKNRKEVLGSSVDQPARVDSVIENAAPGLILRKRKQEEKSDGHLDALQQSTSSSEAERAELKAEDAVALLLKHKRGYHGSDEEERHESKRSTGRNRSKKDEKKSKRVLGPEKPSFLDTKADYESWIPPEGKCFSDFIGPTLNLELLHSL